MGVEMEGEVLAAGRMKRSKSWRVSEPEVEATEMFSAQVSYRLF